MAKDFRNAAKLRVDLFGATSEEQILDAEGKPIYKANGEKLIKKRKLTKTEWALSWNSGLNAQAFRMDHLKDQMLRAHDNIGEENEQEAKNEQVGETRTPSQVAPARVSPGRAAISRRTIAEASRKARETLRKPTA
jgi:hypothetical protein